MAEVEEVITAEIELCAIPVNANARVAKPRKHNEIADALVQAAIENIGMCAKVDVSLLPKTYAKQPGTPIYTIGKRLGVPMGFRLKARVMDEGKKLGVWLAELPLKKVKKTRKPKPVEVFV